MLPSKGHFNIYDCPFYLSPTKCLRPYCHFRHSKRDKKTESSLQKVENALEENVFKCGYDITSTPASEKPVVAPVKHIPIAYIPTKPSAVSVNTKKSKSVYVPSIKNDVLNRSSIMGSVDYDPSSVMDSCEKTYSRYSYEKGHDSGDEIMENHKNLIKSNKIGKYDDGSKSGYDEETDDFLEEPGFSPPISPYEDDIDINDDPSENSKLFDLDSELSRPISEPELNEPRDKSNKETKCRKKRKYSEINEVKSNFEHPTTKDILSNKNQAFSDNVHRREPHSKGTSPKQIKREINENVLLKKDKAEGGNLSCFSKFGENTDFALDSESKKSEKKVCKYKEKKQSSTKDSEKHSGHKKSKDLTESKKSESKKHSSDKKHSKSSENHSSKSHSSEYKKQSSDSLKKYVSEKKSSSSDSKKTSSESSKKNSSESKKHSSKDKKHSSDTKRHSTKKSSDIKKHSSDKNSKELSSRDSHSSERKKHSSSYDKKKENDKNKSSSKSKDHSDENKSSSKNHSGDRRKDQEKNSKNSSKHDHIKNDKGGNQSKRENSKKRKHSDSSDSLISSLDKKETILISDSSDSEEKDCFSPVGIDDISFPSDSSGDENAPSHGLNNHEISDSENDESILFSNLETTSVHKHNSLTNKINESLSNSQQSFKVAAVANAEDSYKPAQTSPKVRIAHVPNVSSLLSAKTLISSGGAIGKATVVRKFHNSVDISKSKTTVKTFPQKAVTSQPKPQVSTNLNSAVAVNIRQPGLNNIYDELIKFVDYDEACHRAIEEEIEICNVATNPQSYRNRIALCILRIRKSKGTVDVVKKEMITSNSIPDYTYGLTLYESFSKYLLQPEDYAVHGYPLEFPDKPGCAYISKDSFFRNKHFQPLEGSFRKCINCGKEYVVDDETGIPLMKNNCDHHWGKLIRLRQGKIYTCCKSEVGSDPCHTSTYHVTELKNDNCLEGFVKTRPYPSDADPNKAGIYAVDCEMCFTTQGRDIVRASLLAVDNESVYDVLIKPKYPVLDYCTRFSGITEEKLESVTTTLEDVQRFLLKTINDKTILVGHSLENDLKALKLLHYNVVDTSLMYPHKEGLPVKCALKTLCSRLLGTAIQTGEHGHDSLEDARACLQLVLRQVREDAKSRKPRVVKQLKTTK